MKVKRREVIRIAILVALYVLIGNARSIEPNPFIPGAVIAVNMVVPVLAGILFGARYGLVVGVIGTFLNALSPAGSLFEYLAILPHGAMGFVAGYFRDRFPVPVLASSLLVGHALNVSMFLAFGAIPAGTLGEASFWNGIAYESFTGIISVIVFATVYRFGFEKSPII